MSRLENAASRVLTPFILGHGNVVEGGGRPRGYVEFFNHGKGAVDPPLLKEEFLYAAEPTRGIPWVHHVTFLLF
jgi:hypothetical protein